MALRSSITKPGNVRHLIKKGHVPSAEWQTLVSSLSGDPVEAWRQLQPVRGAARVRPSADEAAEVFARRFGKGLDELEELFKDPKWRHAKACGGHAWRLVVAIVADLRRAIDQADAVWIREACAKLLNARHNNGPLRQKVLELDFAAGVTTEAWWSESEAGA